MFAIITLFTALMRIIEHCKKKELDPGLCPLYLNKTVPLFVGWRETNALCCLQLVHRGGKPIGEAGGSTVDFPFLVMDS